MLNSSLFVNVANCRTSTTLFSNDVKNKNYANTRVFYVKIRFSNKYLPGRNEHAVYMVNVFVIAVVYQPRRANHYGQKTEIGAVHQPI